MTIHWLTHNPSETAASEQAAEDWVTQYQTEHPGVTIERESVTGDELKTIINDPPPERRRGPRELRHRAPVSPACSTTPVCSRRSTTRTRSTAGRSTTGRKTRATANGVTYGVPDQIEALGLFYNADLLARARVHRAADDPRRVRARWPRPPRPRAHPDRVRQQGPVGRRVDVQHRHRHGPGRQEGRPTCIDGSHVVGLARDHRASSTCSSRTSSRTATTPSSRTASRYDDANALFFSGKSPFLVTGTWHLAGRDDRRLHLQVGVRSRSPPSTGRRHRSRSGSATAGSSPRSPRTKETTLDFLDWILKPERGKTQLEVFETIPAYPIDTASVNVSPLYRQHHRPGDRCAAGHGLGLQPRRS